MGLVLSLFLHINALHAENITQTITLNPGWNAVFLEVDPVSSACADVFSGVTHLESVWTWNPDNSTVEFIQDPNLLTPDMPQWLGYFPENAILTNLHAIYGERVYLIKLGGSQDVQWQVTGEPRLPRIKWQQDSFNLVGFHLDPGNEPFFESFFSSSLAHAGQEIYILNNQGGNWELVADPALTQMKQGEAFWVKCKGHSEFTGPLAVQLNQSDGLHYGKALSEQNVRLLNSSAADADISISLTGNAPLSYWKFDPDNDDVGWRDLPLSFTVSSAGKETIRMGSRRAGLNPDQAYESNLVITDNAGMHIVVPASVEGISHTGLWVGAAIINKVSEPANADDSITPTKTGSKLSFRLILHVDDNGNVQLLKQAIQMWDEAQSRYVLFTDDNLIANYLGDVSSQGPEVRRISTTAFGELNATSAKWRYPMTGTFDEATGELSCTITVRPDDPMNPFRHRYHQHHGDVDKAYEVTREIKMEFTTQDSDGNPITSTPVLSWGGSDMGGVYTEKLTGLHKADINIEGVFLLHKVSSVDNLESGL